MLDLFEELGLTYVIIDEPQGFKSSTPPTVGRTTTLAMLRFHGCNTETWEGGKISASERFRYLYEEAERESWVLAVGRRAGVSEQVHPLCERSVPHCLNGTMFTNAPRPCQHKERSLTS